MKEAFNEMDSNLEKDVGHHTGSFSVSSLPLSFFFPFICFFFCVCFSYFFFLSVSFLYVHTLTGFTDFASSACVFMTFNSYFLRVSFACYFVFVHEHDWKVASIQKCFHIYFLSLSFCGVVLHRSSSGARVESCYFPSSFSPRWETFTLPHFLNWEEMRHPIAAWAGQ